MSPEDYNDKIAMRRLSTNTAGRRKITCTVSRLLKLSVALGILFWGVSLFWISRHASSTTRNAGKTATSSQQNKLGIPKINYQIPDNLIPDHPVRIMDRNSENERIVTKDGRISRLSTEAFREFGEDVRNLIQQGRENLLSRGKTDSTLLFRQYLKARAPWLKGNHEDPAWPYNTMPQPVDGKAIAICAGDPQLHYLKNLIYSIRVDHRSSMPIRIFFLDDHDLTLPSQEAVKSVIPDDTPKNVQFVNLSQYFDLKKVHLKGWDLKSYGLLAIAENELMFLDVDVMLLQSPETMFEQQGYKETGAQFFHDRMFVRYLDFLYDPATYVMALQPNLSDQGKRAIHNGHSPYHSEHIQESGMLLFDKKRSIVGLWAVCLIYGREDVRRYAQRYHMYGDKEMYWTSFEAVGETYAFAKFYPGTIGGVATDFELNDIAILPTDKGPDVDSKLEDANDNHMGLCGRLVHFDDMGQPLWSNGGYLTKEEDWPSTSAIGAYPLNPLWFVDGGDWTAGEEFIPEVVEGPLDQIWSFFAPHPPLEEAYGHWVVVKDHIPMNQYWKIHQQIGVNCLMANAKGIQKVPAESYELASKSVKRFFLEELLKGHKYDKYF